jgi:hypothetical protein
VTVYEILCNLRAQSINIRLKDDKLAVLSGCLSEQQRQSIIANREDLVLYIKAAHKTSVALVKAAIQASDYWNDSNE